MTIYNRSNLIYSDYQWSPYPDGSPKITGELDETLFNRHEGLEVLYMIATMADIHTLLMTASGQKIEKLIHQFLPSGLQSQKYVMEWVAANWHNYVV